MQGSKSHLQLDQTKHWKLHYREHPKMAGEGFKQCNRSFQLLIFMIPSYYQLLSLFK